MSGGWMSAAVAAAARRRLCPLGVHQRRKFICPWCLYLACPPGEAIFIDRCLNPDCPESGPEYCRNHREAS